MVSLPLSLCLSLSPLLPLPFLGDRKQKQKAQRTFVRESLPSLVPLQRDGHERLVRIAHVEGVLGRGEERLRHVDVLVRGFELGLGALGLHPGPGARILVRLVQKAHVVFVGCHVAGRALLLLLLLAARGGGSERWRRPGYATAGTEWTLWDEEYRVE